jgi:hypothetical protein
LVIDKSKLPGRWLCVRRKFVQLGEAAEALQAGQKPSLPIATSAASSGNPVTRNRGG